MAAEATTLFRDFAIVILAAGAMAFVFHQLKQPVVLGYLLAGFVVGPYSLGPSFVGDADVMGFLGELGIAFLLFALGLEFNLRKLRKVGATAIVAGTLEIGLMLSLGYGLGRALGWAHLEAVFLGAIMSISSTTVIVKVLAEMGKKDEDWAQTAFGILIIEDVLAVLILTALGSAGATGNFQPEMLGALAYKLGVFLGAALLLGLLFGPRIVERIAALKVEEVTVVLGTGLGMGMALLASWLGFSAGLGAFVAGALMAESPRVERITHRIEPLRDVFTAIFFVTVGAAVDPRMLLAHWFPILAVAAAVVGGKVFAVTLATFITGAAPGKALRVGMTLAQIGEFAFVIAALGISVGAARPELYAIAIAVSAASAFLTPYLIRASPRLVDALHRRLPAGLHAYLTTYRQWVGRMAKTDRRDPLWRSVRLNALAATLLGAVLVSIFALGVVFQDEMRAFIAARLGDGVARLGLEWLAVSLVASPFAWIWFQEMREVVEALARIAVPQRLRHAECSDTERLLRHTFGFVTTIATAVVCVLVGGLFVDNIVYVLAMAGVGIVIGGVVLGRSLRRFHDEVEATIDRMTHDEAGNVSHAEAMRMLEQAHAWGAASREIVLPDVSGGGGRTLGQLRLRELTGASVLNIHRMGGDPTHNPGPATRLQAGDHVLLVGEEAALLRAEEILLGRELGVEGGATEVRVPLGSPLVGQRADGLALGRATLLVVRRNDEALAVAAVRIEPGDVLVLSGSDEEVETVRARVASPTTDAAPPREEPSGAA